MKIAGGAAELFGTKGYLETSMDDIAAAARVTKGGVYHYFGSKTEILYFICSTYVDIDLENLEQSLTGIQKGVEKIKFITFRHIEHYAAHEYAAKTLLNEAYCLPPKYFKQVKEREKQYFRIVTGSLKKYAPHHLYLGPRFAWHTRESVEACGELCDVVSLSLIHI